MLTLITFTFASDGFNAVSPTERISGRFEHKPLRSMSFLNGNRGLWFVTLYSVSDSLGRLAATGQCMAIGVKVSREILPDAASHCNDILFNSDSFSVMFTLSRYARTCRTIWACYNKPQLLIHRHVIGEKKISDTFFGMHNLSQLGVWGAL